MLVTISFGGSVGLGTVWMRHQISVTANTNRALAAQVLEVERRIAETTTLVESEQSPQLLRDRNTQWHLGLVAIGPTQEEVHVAEDPVRRLVSRANRELFSDSMIAPKIRVSLAQ